MKILFYYGPLAAWMIFIFVMSTGVGDGENSKELIQRILERWAPDIAANFRPSQIEMLNYILRKTGHVAEYFVLMGLAIRAFQFGSPKLKWYSPIVGLGLCATYAASDEFHQSFVSGRSAAFTDVSIDIFGALLCLAFMLAWFAVKDVERRLWNQNVDTRAESADSQSVVLERAIS